MQKIDTRKSLNHQQKNFIICERIIQSLCFLGWTLPEIAQSGNSLLAVLVKYVDLEGLRNNKILKKDTNNWSFDGGEWSAVASGLNLCGLEGSFTFDPNNQPDVSADGEPWGGGSPFTFHPNNQLDALADGDPLGGSDFTFYPHDLPDVSADGIFFGGDNHWTFNPNDQPDVSADGDPLGGGRRFTFHPNDLPDVSADDLLDGGDPFAIDLNHVTSTYNPEEGGLS